MTSVFKQHIVYLDANSADSDYLPDRFTNKIYYSEIEHFNTEFNESYHSPFSIKHSVTGSEEYRINGKARQVGEGECMMVNAGSDTANHSTFGSSFSIFLSDSVLQQCHHDLLHCNDVLLEKPLDTQYIVPEFCDFSNPLNGPLKEIIQQLLSKLKSYPDMQISYDFYFELAEKVLLLQNDKLKSAHSLPFHKIATRIELYKRLSIAKQYLDDTTNSPFNLDSLCAEVGMSPYHLMRNFKALYQITPHRYFVIKKTNKAKYLMKNQPLLSLTEISDQLGYPDIQSFSRQFKNIEGISPSQYLIN